jgi:hypothetical protein
VNQDDRRARTAVIEKEAAAIRQRLDELLAELDHRRRPTMFVDLAQIKAYVAPALAGAAVVGGVVALIAWRRREARRLRALPRHLQTALTAALVARLARIKR